MKKRSGGEQLGNALSTILVYCSVATKSHRQYFVLHGIRIDERKRFEPLFIAVVGKGGGWIDDVGVRCLACHSSMGMHVRTFVRNTPASLDQ